MNYAAFILCLVSLSQVTPSIPEGTTVFTVTLKEGNELRTVNAAIRAKGAFLDYYDKLNAPPQLELILDEPWNDYPVLSVTRLRIESAQPEPTFQQEKRYDESGYILTESGGESVWVPLETNRKHDRMLALKQAQNEAWEHHIAAVSTDVTQGEVIHSGPGVAAKWGRHVVVVVLAVVSVVVVLRVFY